MYKRQIERAEDRELFKELCQGLGEPVLPSEIAETLEDGLRAAAEIGYPVVLRPAFTLGGTGGGFADDEEECRVMLKNAPIIILDEATAFADPDNESRVQAAFSRLSEGKTVIMIAHRLSTVTNVDQIFVICDGQVAECGNSRELLAKDGIFSRMWKNYQTSVQWKVTKEVQ